MTNQEKIKWLRRYGTIDRQIDDKLERLACWRARAVKMTGSCDGLPGGGNGDDGVQAAVEKIVEIEQQINDAIDRLVDVKREIEAAIATVPDKRYREVLERRYIGCETWEGMAVKMGYSYQHVCRLHGEVLNLLHVIECDSQPVV